MVQKNQRSYDPKLFISSILRELHLNIERRENHFDTQGYQRTTSKMHLFDFLYNILAISVHGCDKSFSSKTDKTKVTRLNRHFADFNSKSVSKKKEKKENEFHEERSTTLYSGEVFGSHMDKSKKGKFAKSCPNFVSWQEFQRLLNNANSIMNGQSLSRLQVIHRYRPNSRDIALVTENGHVHNYSWHVGSALHAKNYVDYYMREGLQTGKTECSRRLQRLSLP